MEREYRGRIQILISFVAFLNLSPSPWFWPTTNIHLDHPLCYWLLYHNTLCHESNPSKATAQPNTRDRMKYTEDRFRRTHCGFTIKEIKSFVQQWWMLESRQSGRAKLEPKCWKPRCWWRTTNRCPSVPDKQWYTLDVHICCGGFFSILFWG